MGNMMEGSDVLNEDLSVKKKNLTFATSSDPVEPMRRALLAMGELGRSLTDASAEAYKALNEELQFDRVRSNGLTNGLIEGIAEGNVRFFERLARSSRAALNRLRAESAKETESLAANIDYDRLAKLVAAELSKAGPRT